MKRDEGLERIAKKMYIAYLEFELNWKYQIEEDAKRGKDE